MKVPNSFLLLILLPLSMQWTNNSEAMFRLFRTEDSRKTACSPNLIKAISKQATRLILLIVKALNKY